EPVARDSAEVALVGREWELAAILGGMEGAERGRGHTVLLLGTAGIGKTRLLDEAAATARLRGWRVVAAVAGSEGQAGPFAVWSSALRTLLLTMSRALEGLPR